MNLARFRVHELLSRLAVSIVVTDAVNTSPEVCFHLEKGLREVGVVPTLLLCLQSLEDLHALTKKPCGT